MKIFSLLAGLGTLFLAGCGQSYRLENGLQGALVYPQTHVEANPGEIVPTTESTPTPTPQPSASPQPTATPQTPSDPKDPKCTKDPKDPKNPTVTDDPTDPLSKYSCGKKADKKVYICHRPKGNPTNEHTLCIAIQGAINGHGVPMDGSRGLTGDQLGQCSSQ